MQFHFVCPSDEWGFVFLLRQLGRGCRKKEITANQKEKRYLLTVRIGNRLNTQHLDWSLGLLNFTLNKAELIGNIEASSKLAFTKDYRKLLPKGLWRNPWPQGNEMWSCCFSVKYCPGKILCLLSIALKIALHLDLVAISSRA